MRTEEASWKSRKDEEILLKRMNCDLIIELKV